MVPTFCTCNFIKNNFFELQGLPPPLRHLTFSMRNAAYGTSFLTSKVFFLNHSSVNHLVQKLYIFIGTNGHGALLLKDTAPEKLRILLDRCYDYRDVRN